MIQETYKRPAIIKFWKHIYLPMCNVKDSLSEGDVPWGREVTMSDSILPESDSR